MGTLKAFQADISIDPQVIPKYFCARPVPYSLKEKTEHELKWLVKLQTYCLVASSKWAVPIQICSSYKQTLNNAANCDKYPPKIWLRQKYFCFIECGGSSQNYIWVKPIRNFFFHQIQENLSPETLTKDSFNPPGYNLGYIQHLGYFKENLKIDLHPYPM